MESNVVFTEAAYSPPGVLHWILCIDKARDAIQYQQGDQNLDCIYHCMMIKEESRSQCGALVHASSTCSKPFCLTVRKRRPLPISLCMLHWFLLGHCRDRISFLFSLPLLCASLTPPAFCYVGGMHWLSYSLSIFLARLKFYPKLLLLPWKCQGSMLKYLIAGSGLMDTKAISL